MYSVTVKIEFCYGHRLWNYEGKCHRLHGHNATVEIEVTDDRLTEQGFVVDFTVLKKEIKGWIDENIDHRMILGPDDPMRDIMFDYNEDYVGIDVPPTAENLAKWILDKAVRIDKRVVCVRLWETPTSMAEVWE
jgi:6-pyruvoyltetrahydropterin/6-carboxytetrahydropterin synthase